MIDESKQPEQCVDSAEDKYSAFDRPTAIQDEKTAKKNKISRRTRTLLLTTVLAVVLAVAVLLVTLLPTATAGSSSVSGGDVSEPEASIILLDKIPADGKTVALKQADITYDGNSYTILYNEKDKVYQLKGYEDLYPNDLAERLMIRSGYEADDLIRTYAEIGQMRYQRLTDENCAVLTLHQMEEITDRLQPADAAVFEASYETVTGITHADDVGGEYKTDSYRLKEGQSVQAILDTLNRVKFTWIREDSEITVTGVTEDCVEDAACELYALGILDGTDGVIDMTERLSCGQSLSCAYRFACAMTNAG